MTAPLRIALVGYGKIAKDQHIHCIDANPDFELSCLVSRSIVDADVPMFRSLNEAIESETPIDAVVLCTPPSVRLEVVELALRAGCSVMLEKPPAANIREARKIMRLVEETDAIVFATWHSRFAAMVGIAAETSQSKEISKIDIIWHESVYKWHPGQHWLWEKGAFGVFDMGINALSILTRIHPVEYKVQRANLKIPLNLQAPVSANVRLEDPRSVPVDISLDFLAGDQENWTIRIDYEDDSSITLFDGGAGLIHADGASEVHANREYHRIYERFSEMIRKGFSDVDTQPLQIVDEIFEVATIEETNPIEI